MRSCRQAAIGWAVFFAFGVVPAPVFAQSQSTDRAPVADQVDDPAIPQVVLQEDTDNGSDDKAGIAKQDDAARQSGEDGAVAENVPEPPNELTIASWGGAYQRAQEIALINPYAKRTGALVKTIAHNKSQGTARAGGDKFEWDVADLPAHIADMACKEGVLETIDPSQLSPASDGTDAVEDFLPGGLAKCAVASVAWSSVVVVNRKAFKGARPKSLEDVFDPKRFPGKRAFPRRPRYVLEMALMADGVELEHLYAELARPEGVKRAFDKLETIRSEIVWWQKPQEPTQYLADGKAAMAVAFNGRVFGAIARKSREFAIMWDGQIYDLDVWVIAKTARNKQLAREFLAFATEPKRMAEQASWFPYGPMRRSAIDLVDRHAALGLKLVDYLPTAPANRERALQIDNNFWSKNEAALTVRLETWIKGDPDEADNAKNGPADGTGSQSDKQTSN